MTYETCVLGQCKVMNRDSEHLPDATECSQYLELQEKGGSAKWAVQPPLRGRKHPRGGGQALAINAKGSIEQGKLMVFGGRGRQLGITGGLPDRYSCADLLKRLL